jgi:hypothetical protein
MSRREKREERREKREERREKREERGTELKENDESTALTYPGIPKIRPPIHRQ